MNKSLFRKVLQYNFPDLARISCLKKGHGDVEDWTNIIRTSSAIQVYLRQRLLHDSNGLFELIDAAWVRQYLDDFLLGRATSGRTPALTVIQGAQKAMVKYPRLYRALKRRTIRYLHFRELDPAAALLRLLVLTRVYERHGRGVAPSLPARRQPRVIA
jgi:hypothetical protein